MGPRAQFGRRPEPAPAVIGAGAVAAAPAGRWAARRSVAAPESSPGRGLRDRMAVPVLALVVVAVTWVDAGVLRAADTPPQSAMGSPEGTVPGEDIAPGQARAASEDQVLPAGPTAEATGADHESRAWDAGEGVGEPEKKD